MALLVMMLSLNFIWGELHLLLIAKSEFGHARAQGILMNLQVTLWNIIQWKLEHGIVLFLYAYRYDLCYGRGWFILLMTLRHHLVILTLSSYWFLYFFILYQFCNNPVTQKNIL